MFSDFSVLATCTSLPKRNMWCWDTLANRSTVCAVSSSLPAQPRESPPFVENAVAESLLELLLDLYTRLIGDHLFYKPGMPCPESYPGKQHRSIHRPPCHHGSFRFTKLERHWISRAPWRTFFFIMFSQRKGHPWGALHSFSTGSSLDDAHTWSYVSILLHILTAFPPSV